MQDYLIARATELGILHPEKALNIVKQTTNIHRRWDMVKSILNIQGLPEPIRSEFIDIALDVLRGLDGRYLSDWFEAFAPHIDDMKLDDVLEIVLVIPSSDVLTLSGLGKLAERTDISHPRMRKIAENYIEICEEMERERPNRNRFDAMLGLFAKYLPDDLLDIHYRRVMASEMNRWTAHVLLEMLLRLNDEKRNDTIAGLGEYLLKSESLDYVLLQHLAVHLEGAERAEVLEAAFQAALEVFKADKERQGHLDLLMNIVTQFPDEHILEKAELVIEICSATKKTKAIIKLLPFLTENARRKQIEYVLKFIKTLPDDQHGLSWLLMDIANYLNDRQLEIAVEDAFRIPNSRLKAECLARYIPLLDEEIADKTCKRIYEECLGYENQYATLRSFTELIPVFPDSFIKHVFDYIIQLENVYSLDPVFAALAPRLSYEQVQDVLDLSEFD